MPRTRYYLFRACPDGEGTWLQRHYDDPSVVALRRKGKFTQEMVDWYSRSLDKCQMAPLILVDIGGIPSPENQRILVEGGVTHAIILAGNKEQIPVWEKFLTSCGVTVIAVLHSDYTGEQDSFQHSSSRLEGSVHHLDRDDKTVDSRPTIQATAAVILDFIQGEIKEMSSFVNGSVLSIPALAETLGKQEEERTLPNGRTVRQLTWVGEDLPRIAELLHNHVNELPESVDIDGPAPAWLVTALIHEVHPRHARVNSPDGFVGVACGGRPEGHGSGPVTWTVAEGGTTSNGRRVVRIEFALDPSVPFRPEQLDEVVPPAVELGDVIVLSGRGPNWLTASIAMAYHGRAAACACFQPGTGGTVSWTHVADVPLGSIVP
ncbi:MAG: hypothetical protein EPO02_09380 [Nitrospirae bacterium]|nr:MAG: hypothetical protein EPO02_09380 [Nitrospirota bacterium]